MMNNILIFLSAGNGGGTPQDRNWYLIGALLHQCEASSGSGESTKDKGDRSQLKYYYCEEDKMMLVSQLGFILGNFTRVVLYVADL